MPSRLISGLSLGMQLRRIAEITCQSIFGLHLQYSSTSDDKSARASPLSANSLADQTDESACKMRRPACRFAIAILYRTCLPLHNFFGLSMQGGGISSRCEDSANDASRRCMKSSFWRNRPRIVSSTPETTWSFNS